MYMIIFQTLELYTDAFCISIISMNKPVHNAMSVTSLC